MTDAAPTVIFDFDLTLTQWDTAERFFTWLLRRDVCRLAVVFLCAPLLAPFLLIAATRLWPIHFAVWIATFGRSANTLQKLAFEHVRTLPQSAFLDQGLTQLQEHLSQGHRVVIATGCLAPLVEAFLVVAGLAHVPVVASTLRPFLGGLTTDRHCIAANKVRMLYEAGFSAPWNHVYTDHRSDLPILRLSDQCYLINPKPGCLACIRQNLPTEPIVLRWRNQA